MLVENKISAVFLDADGVLWKDIGPGGILTGKNQSIINLKLLDSNQKKSQMKIVISNQTFAARNKMNYLRFRVFTNYFFKSLIKLDLIHDFAVCYHHPNANNSFLRKKCNCRKPLPGLIKSMMRKHNIAAHKSSLIGDRITDIQSGAAAGIENLFLIINSKMLEINENSSSQPLQTVFIPLKDLAEFSLIEEKKDEN